ncbi:MAG: winged helix-turn-helix transcriptional regulator [Zoogloeaceae bacterium]|nr:winged helix-turn-helix transcriptional regulator [Zoogloeaceae bacterium]
MSAAGTPEGDVAGENTQPASRTSPLVEVGPSALDLAAPELGAPANPPSTTPRHDLRILQALRQIVRGVELYSKQVAATSQITLPQLVCLLSVVNHGPLTAGTIGRQIHLSASTVVGILDRLEEKGLIVRERDRRDRRVVFVTATPKGVELAATAPSPLQRHLAEAVNALPELEQATMAQALERIVELMEKGAAAVVPGPGAPAANPATGGPTPAD